MKLESFLTFFSNTSSAAQTPDVITSKNRNDAEIPASINDLFRKIKDEEPINDNDISLFLEGIEQTDTTQLLDSIIFIFESRILQAQKDIEEYLLAGKDVSELVSLEKSHWLNNLQKLINLNLQYKDRKKCYSHPNSSTIIQLTLAFNTFCILSKNTPEFEYKNLSALIEINEGLQQINNDARPFVVFLRISVGTNS